jgi:aminoglycoside 3-N-acetyltransferase
VSEAETIARTPAPRTRLSLGRDLRALGVEAGMTVLVHSSLRALGWVSGGAVAAIQALMDALTPAGTLLMPAHSGDLSDPAHWENPPVPESWWADIRASMPAYDVHATPSRGLGRIAELFRTWPGVVRSAHPTASFAAWGPHAAQLTEAHALESDMGEASPLGRLYALEGWVLLLGVGYAVNSSFHLAEYRIGDQATIEQGSPVMKAGERVWVTYRGLDLDDTPFPQIGAQFEAAGNVRQGLVGSAQARLFPQRPAVDFAVAWLTKRRGPHPGGTTHPGN